MTCGVGENAINRKEVRLDFIAGFCFELDFLPELLTVTSYQYNWAHF